MESALELGDDRTYGDMETAVEVLRNNRWDPSKPKCTPLPPALKRDNTGCAIQDPSFTRNEIDADLPISEQAYDGTIRPIQVSLIICIGSIKPKNFKNRIICANLSADGTTTLQRNQLTAFNRSFTMCALAQANEYGLGRIVKQENLVYVGMVNHTHLFMTLVDHIAPSSTILCGPAQIVAARSSEKAWPLFDRYLHWASLQS